MNEIERRVRQMTKAERRAYLLDRGWTRIGDSWHHPSYDETSFAGDRGFYSLAAAIRTALQAEDDAVTRPGDTEGGQ